MNTLTKKRIIRDFDKLDGNLQKQVLGSYPYGLSQESMSFININGKTVPTISFETDDTFYLLRLPSSKPIIRIKKDDYGTEYVHLEEMKADLTSDEEQGYDDDDEPEDSYYSDFQNYDEDSYSHQE